MIDPVITPEKISTAEPERSAYSIERYVNALSLLTPYRAIVTNIGEITKNAVGPSRGRIVLNLEGLPTSVAVFCLSDHPLQKDSPDDVIQVTIRTPRSGHDLDWLVDDGYSQRVQNILELTPAVVSELHLDRDHSRVVEMVRRGMRLPYELLELRVTREELPTTIPVVSAFLRASAFRYGLSEKLDREEILSLAAAGLISSPLAPVIRNLEQPSELLLLDIASAAQPNKLNIDLPLSDTVRSWLKVGTPKYWSARDLGIVAKVGLAVIEKDFDHTDDYNLARDALCHSMLSYYFSPQAQANDKQFNQYRDRQKLAEQMVLYERFAATNGYHLSDYVTIPKATAPAAFSLPLPKATGTEDLMDCLVQSHFRHGTYRITDPQTGVTSDRPWIYRESDKDYLIGDEVNRLMSEAVKEGYLVIAQGANAPLVKELCNLWDLVQNDLWDRSRRPGPVDAFICMREGNSATGKIYSVHFSDDSFQGAGIDDEALETLQTKLAEDLCALPAEVREYFEQKRNPPHRILREGQAGYVLACENHPRTLEILFDYLRTRAKTDWISRGTNS